MLCRDRMKLFTKSIPFLSSVAPLRVNSKMLEYKKFSAEITYSEEDHVFHGRISGADYLISFCAENAADIEREFKAAIDEYLAFCSEIGKIPATH